MEPQPETATATVRVCGHDIQTTAEELKLAGLQVKDPADFTALSHGSCCYCDSWVTMRVSSEMQCEDSRKHNKWLWKSSNHHEASY